MLPACARNVYVRLPKNCTEAPAHSAGSRATVGVMPSTRMQAENNEKSTIVAPLPTIKARAKRSARKPKRSPSLTFGVADHVQGPLETSRAPLERQFTRMSRARDERTLRERTVQGLPADRHVQLPVRPHQFEFAVLVELLVERVQEPRIEAIHLDALHVVNRPGAGLAQQQRQFDVREQQNLAGGLAGLVQALGRGATYVDPGAQHARGVAHRKRCFFGRG